MSNLKFILDKGYWVDKQGNAISPNNNIVGHLTTGTLKYLEINTGSRGTINKCRVHRLQAYQKYGEAMFEPGIVVRHLNGNPLDNSWDNIVIGTVQDNMLDIDPAERLEHALKGSRVQRKLSWQEMEQLRKDRKQGDSYKILCKRYNVSKSTVSYIVNNKTYNIE